MGAWEKSLDEVLLKFGVTKEKLQENAAEELESTLQDYHDLAKQYSDMLSKYCYEEKPVLKDGIWHCPKCHRRVRIQSYRYLMSRQIQRLLFTDAATPSAALRATNRSLKKLKELGLITSLSRRIGGVRSGSGSYTWYLTHAGERLLRLHGETRSSSTQFDPSPYFLAHTLAVAETAIQLTEISRKSQLELKALQAEPGCWRSYSEYGTLVSLKPDLYAITISGEYEDRYFLEVDLSTESIARIIEKCERYHKYYLSGIEQEITGVFPLTVWIVPTENRKNKLIESLKPAFDKRPKLFAVITTNELEHLICDGGDNRMLC